MTKVTVAATQMACSWDLPSNIANAEKLVRQAHAQGAQIILIQELFAAPYFCIDQSPEHYALAEDLATSPLIKHFSALAAELEVVLPLSFFERANNAYYNSLVMIDADGAVLDVYRKTHIPNGPAYQEKQFFIPGDTGFKVWQTRYAKVGVGICWDQWFPETARCLALQGAELIFYPTAIGSEPAFPAGPCRRQPDPGDRFQPHRHRSQQIYRRSGNDLLRLLVHRRPDRRAGGAGQPHRRNGAGAQLRSGRDRQNARHLGPVPRGAGS